uniref:Evasin n=1 Tax=Rhipicephalus appendiculatus TaxID=34631 RepID=A0A131YU65_RHIAP
MFHLRALPVGFFAVAVIMMTASPATHGRRQTGRGSSSTNCAHYNCTMDRNYRVHSQCPQGCTCPGFDRTAEVPKVYACIEDKADGSRGRSHH